MKNNDRRSFLAATSALFASLSLPAWGNSEKYELHQPGTLRIAVYQQFAPYSDNGKGVDIDIAKALAEKLGLLPQIVEFPSDEDMSDDLRNMVWRGHYLGTKPGDVMMHVPVDLNFARQNDEVTIFGPYQLETMAMARKPERVPTPSGSAAAAFEVFTREKIGVELDTHSSDFLLHVLNGRLRENVLHFKNVTAAVDAMKDDEVVAVLATRTQLEAAVAGTDGIVIDNVNMPELRVTSWPIGMAVKASSNELEGALSEALATLQRSGELTAIFKQHGLTHLVP